MMRHRFAVGAVVVVTLAMSACSGGAGDKSDGFKSGPQVGGRCAPFHPLNITGPHKDEKQCLV